MPAVRISRYPQQMEYVLDDIFNRFDPEHLTHRLTSDTIGQVLQRASPGGFGSFADKSAEIDATRLSSSVPPPRPVTLASKALTKSIPKTPTTQQMKTVPAGNKPKPKRVYAKTERRRLQCLASQKRYIQRQKKYTKNLEATVAQLKHEIPLLQARHSRLLSTERSAIWKVGVEYFQLFGYGIRSESQSLGKTGIKYPEKRQQMAFLRATMAANIALGGLEGPEVILEQVWRYSTYFDDHYLKLDHINQVSRQAIITSATLTLVVSELTLQQVFPGLLSRAKRQGEHDRREILRTKLLGQRLRVSCTFCMEWDDSTRQVVRMEHHVDFLPPLTQLLGTLENAAFALNQSTIASNSAIGEHDVYNPIAFNQRRI